MNSKRLWISVDVEADGPCPGSFNMVCFGAVVVESDLNRTFYGETAPVFPRWVPEALAVSGFTREQHEKFDSPKVTMDKFHAWLKSLKADKLVFVSDNNGFDWQFINWYFWEYRLENPFGFSSRRIGDIYSGLNRSAFTQNDWKKLYRKTRHSHNPVDDAKGNAEALLAFRDKLGFRF